MEPAVDLVGDTVEHSIKTMPKMNPVSVSAPHSGIRGNCGQEMAYAILIANAYIDNVLKRGYDIDTGSMSIPHPLFRTLSM